MQEAGKTGKLLKEQQQRHKVSKKLASRSTESDKQNDDFCIVLKDRNRIETEAKLKSRAETKGNGSEAERQSGNGKETEDRKVGNGKRRETSTHLENCTGKKQTTTIYVNYYSQ